MGYKVQFEDGTQVEFDGQPSQQDIEDAHSQISGAPKGRGLLDIAGGAAETLTTGALDAFGGIGAAALGSMKGALSPNSTASQGRDEMSRAYANSTVHKLLEPQTQTGKDVGEFIGHQIDQLRDDLGTAYVDNPNLKDAPEFLKTLGKLQASALSVTPEAAMLLPFAKGRGAKADTVKGKGPDPDAALAASSSSAVDRPHNDVFEEMAQQLQAGQKSNVDFPSNNGMNTVVDSLQKQQEAQRAAEAQRALDERQAQLEQDVKRQQSLDFNAQERARQENAPTGFAEHLRQQAGDRAVATTAEGLLNPADRMKRQFEREQVPTEGANPLYVTPDKQVLNIRPDDMAMEALRRQKEAGQNALDHGLVESRSEPLSLLQRDQLRASNEGVPLARPEDHINANMQTEMLSQAIEDHPLVKNLQDRITKQEALITKMQMAGKVVPSRLAREVKSLEGMEKALERTKQNVERGLREQKRPVPFNFKKQGGAINPEVFKEGFEKLKKLADGTWLRAYARSGALEIEAHKDGHILANVTFDPKKDNQYGFSMIDHDPQANLEAFSVKSKKSGMASEMYKFASELGNDIKSSPVQTQAGRAMWQGFERKGFADKGMIKSPGNKQRGALLIDPRDEGKGKFLSDHPALKLQGIVPDKLTPETALEMAKKSEDVKQNFLQKTANFFTKGGLYQALKTGNPLVRYGVERVLDEDRGYRGDVQTHIMDKNTGLAPIARALSDREAAQVWEVISKADKSQARLTEEGLRAGGYSDKQIEFWKRHTEGMDAAFKAINEARTAAGMTPIDKRVAYAAMRSSGDFKRLVYSDPERTNIVGVIGSDYRFQVDKLSKLMEEKGYHVGKEQYFAGTAMKRGSPAEAALQRTLEALADKDPRVMDFMQTMDEIVRNEAYSMLNMKKHTLQKKGVFGMEGRKDWVSAEQNAREGIQAQLDYMDSAFKWAHMSKAAEDIRPLLTDKTVTEKMPKAKEWLETYLNNAMGYNPSKMGQGLSQAIASGMEHFGVGYTALRGAQSAARKTVNSVLLGLNPMFWLTNVIQPLRSMPGMMAYLTSKGLDKNFDFGTGWMYLGKAAITDFKERFTPSNLSAVEKGALDYAREKHVYGSDLVEHSHRAAKDLAYGAEKVSNFAAGGIETATRKSMYLAFVDMLHENGLSVQNGLYEAAHNLTDMTMNNYSRVERPQVYNSLGPFGDMAVNLSSFKHNELSRTALFARQIAESKTAKPLLVELATGVAFSGLTGMIAFDVADELYKLITKIAGHPDSLKMRAIKLSEETAKMFGANKNTTMGYNSQYVLSHGAFSLLGVDMSNRLGLNNLIGATPSDIMFPGVSKLADIAGAAKDMVYTNGELHAPTEMDAKRLVREASPGIAQGAEDLTWFSKNMGQDAHNRKNLEFQVKRNTPDIIWKLAGGTGIHESVQKDLRYEADFPGAAQKDRRAAIFADIRDTLFTDNKVDAAKVQEYVKNGGDPKSLLSQIDREAIKQAIPRYRREMMQSAVSKSITKIEAGRRVTDAYENQPTGR